MKRYQFITLSVLLTLLILTGVFYIGRVSARPRAQVNAAPDVVSYQGRVTQGGSPFTGTGHFKFAVVDSAGSTTYWSNDGTSSGASEPSSAVQLTVANGLFNVLLGDTNLSNMTSLPSSVFDGPDRYLRVWFSPAGSSFTRLSPDRKIASVPYALKAQDAETLGGKDSSVFVTETELDAQLTSLQTDVSALKSKLNSVTVKNSGQDVVFTGVNVHIRDGSGDTDGSTNGLGNLIVGYNEDTGDAASRGGSHNIVLGPEHSYPSYGGLVAGYENSVSGKHATVTGGQNNAASGDYAAVLGGGGFSVSSADGNEAWAWFSTVAGGQANVAGDVSGGNRRVGEASSVLAGLANETTQDLAAVSGGYFNVASGRRAAVSGGYDNEASSNEASVSGGQYNIASDSRASVSGGSNNEASGLTSSISGGSRSTASGDTSAVSGGWSVDATGDYATVSGGRNNTASGEYATVSGGQQNEAGGQDSVIGGGSSRTVTGDEDWQAGSLFETQ